MTPPVMPENERERQARIRSDLQKLTAAVREGKLPEAAIQRYLERERVTPEQELARTPMDTRDRIANTARSVYQGMSLNFGDELMGSVRGMLDPNMSMAEGIADERAQMDRFRQENPGAAFASEMAGGLVTGLGASKTGGQFAKMMLRRPIATAAGTGAVAGAGAGESPTGRVVGAAGGGAVGGLLGAAANRVVNSPTVQRGVRVVTRALDDVQASGQPVVEATAPARLRTPNVTAARQSVARVLADETGSMDAARREIVNLEAAGMGDEALLLNVGGEPAARTARAVANAPSVPFARTSANEVLGDALARQGGALGDAVADDIGRATGLGGTPGPVRLMQLQDELSAKTGPAFDAFRARGPIFINIDDEAAEGFAKYLSAVKRNPAMAELPGNDAAVIDEAFKLLQQDVRMAGRGEDAVRQRGLRELRNRVLGAIEQVDPAYAEAVNRYALDGDVGKVVQDAFADGLRLRTAPTGTFTANSRGLPDPAVTAMRTGAATGYQSAADDAASNVALGELARFRDVARNVVGTKGQAARFKEIFGADAYDDLLGRLKPKIRAAALNAIVRGNSTTARQLLDALAIGEDAIVDVLNAATSGQGLVSAGIQKLRAPVAAMRAAGLGETATEAANLLSVRGPKRIRIALDALERIAKDELARKRAVQPVAGAAARSVMDRVP